MATTRGIQGTPKNVPLSGANLRRNQNSPAFTVELRFHEVKAPIRTRRGSESNVRVAGKITRVCPSPRVIKILPLPPPGRTEAVSGRADIIITRI